MQTLLSRRAASQYLEEHHGLDISHEQLARLAVKGGGPKFFLLAGRIGRAAYKPEHLDEWAGGYLGPPVARVIEHPAHRSAA